MAKTLWRQMKANYDEFRVQNVKTRVEQKLLMVKIVEEVLGDLRDSTDSKLIKEFGSKIIDFFATNPDIDSDSMSTMGRNDLGNRLKKHFKNPKMRGFGARLRRVILKKLEEQQRDLMQTLKGEKESNKMSNTKQKIIPQYISGLIKSQTSNKPHIRLLYGELVKEYKFLHCILKSKTAKTVNIANIAVMFRKAEVITLVLNEGDRIRSGDWQSLTMDMNKIYEMGLSTKIRFDLSRYPSDERETTYNNAVSFLTQYGDVYKCEQANGGNMLIFEVADITKQPDSADASSPSTAARCKRAQLMIEGLSAAQSMLSAQKKPQQKEEHEEAFWKCGKQWYFWDSTKKHPNYVAGKFKDVKEEILNSPTLNGCISAKQWDVLLQKVRTNNNMDISKS